MSASLTKLFVVFHDFWAAYVFMTQTAMEFSRIFLHQNADRGIPSRCGLIKHFSERSSDKSSELEAHQMPVRHSLGQIFRAEPSSNLYRPNSRVDPPSRAPIKSLCGQVGHRSSTLWRLILDSALRSMCRAPLQLTGSLLDYIIKVTHYAIGGVAVLILHPQESPPLQLSGCVELWLPPTPLPGCPFFVLYFNAARMRCEDDGTGPPRPLGSSLGPRPLRSVQVGAAACWWIPAGGDARLCSHI